MTATKLKLDKSLSMQARAKGCIPGMNQLLSKRPDMFSLGAWPGYFESANGVTVYDLDGNQYTDMSISGIGANVLGYADPDVDAAVAEAIRRGTSCSLNCPEEVELAELLCNVHPWADMVRYARTGGEAMAIAVRIARAHTQKDKIAFCGYHGWHDWYLAANLGTENALGEHLLGGLNPLGVPKGLTGTAIPFRYNHLENLESIVCQHKNEIGVIVLESIRSDYPEPGFIEGVRSLADEIKAVLVIDEISAGFRLNSGGAHLAVHSSIPDIAVFSKAMGNGYPIAAIIGKASVMESAQKTFISSTYWSERIGPTAAIATITKHKKLNVAEHLMSLGKSIQIGWKDAAEKHGLDISVGGIYPLSHFSFNHDYTQALKAYFIELMLDRGFLASNLFYAMHAHSDGHVKDYLAAVDEAFSEIANTVRVGDILSKLRGAPAVAGFKRIT